MKRSGFPYPKPRRRAAVTGGPESGGEVVAGPGETDMQPAPAEERSVTSTFTVTLPSGVEWIPAFVDSIDITMCIGCGRCYKVCSQRVLELRGLDEDGEFVSLDDEDEYERKVMTPEHRENCIGCRACALVCSKKCINHTPASV
jgi:Nif-specific ferredoxin III